MATITSHAEAVVEAFNGADWDAIRDLAGDSTYIDVPNQLTIDGADALVEYSKAWKGAMPDVIGTITNVVEGGNHVALEITWQGTHTGDFVTEMGTIPASGNQMTTPGTWIFEYDEAGNPKESRNYFDMLTVMRAFGAA